MSSPNIIQDASSQHWVYRVPKAWQPFLQLSRLDRPIGYWLLALPGWIGLAFAALTEGFSLNDLKWALLILIGAIAMRGAGCTYNDIVDQDLDAKVERTALRPLPSGTVTTKQAWLWLLIQCFIGLIVLLLLPRFAQIIAICSLPLVAAYPFMKRITWWPQIWLGFTFNWAVLVAFAAKTGSLTLPIGLLYAALIFWTIGYDTIYACQDIEDDALIGIKSTAIRFGNRVKLGVGICYSLCIILLLFSQCLQSLELYADNTINALKIEKPLLENALFTIVPFGLHLLLQIIRIDEHDTSISLKLFKSNFKAACILISTLILSAWYWNYGYGI